jgi:hypothetical protein
MEPTFPFFLPPLPPSKPVRQFPSLGVQVNDNGDDASSSPQHHFLPSSPITYVLAHSIVLVITWDRRR